MKHTLSIIAVVAAIIIGYFALTRTLPAPAAPTDTAQGKIDVNAVCEGALAYMSFPDGASAEAFLTECKEGKHPEVIDRYIADLELGAGAQI